MKIFFGQAMVCGVRRAPRIDCCYGYHGCHDIIPPFMFGTFGTVKGLLVSVGFDITTCQVHVLTRSAKRPLLAGYLLLMQICLHMFEVFSLDMRGRRPALTSHNCFEILGP